MLRCSDFKMNACNQRQCNCNVIQQSTVLFFIKTAGNVVLSWLASSPLGVTTAPALKRYRSTRSADNCTVYRKLANQGPLCRKYMASARVRISPLVSLVLLLSNQALFVRDGSAPSSPSDLQSLSLSHSTAPNRTTCMHFRLTNYNNKS